MVDSTAEAAMRDSDYPGTAGCLYVPDAQSGTVKVYDPSFSTTTPKETIAGPPGGFGSLHDSVVAADDFTGEVYVVDTLGPQLSEEPQATIWVFGPSGAFEGRLKHNTIDAAPVGLAVDDSTQRRVYLTSGITENAGIYGYPAHAATSASEPPFTSSGGGDFSLTAAATDSSTPATPAATPHSHPSRASTSSISQMGNLRVTVGGDLRPKRLPRKGSAPIAVSVSGEISTDQSPPPSLQTLRIELNRHGRIDNASLATCPYDRIQPGTSSHARAACRPALVGKGTYGTALIAPLPAGMKAWGRLTGLSMTLSRRYVYRGQDHSFISSGCPAAKGFAKGIFPLARACFAFAGGATLSSVLSGSCQARE
jgi:hypothetical protein